MIAWEPPHRLALDWQLSAQFAFDPALHTTVEVRFTADGAHTIVAFEHRDLENFGEGSGETRNGMDAGWGELLAGFEAALA